MQSVAFHCFLIKTVWETLNGSSILLQVSPRVTARFPRGNLSTPNPHPRASTVGSQGSGVPKKVQTLSCFWRSLSILLAYLPSLDGGMESFRGIVKKKKKKKGIVKKKGAVKKKKHLEKRMPGEIYTQCNMNLKC